MAASKPTDQPAAGFDQTATLRQQATEVAESVDLSRRAAAVRGAAAGAPRVPGYNTVELLGKGAYGEVWRAEQVRTSKQVALKLFVQRQGLDWIFLQREVERLVRLDRHPHIVTLLDTDLASEPPFYAMDLIEGGSLEQFVGEGKRVPVARALRWTEQICDALTYVHGKGLIHCDLKPANVLVDEQDNVRVVDFGQSRIFTESSQALGTLYYMAPDQARLGESGSPVQPDVRWDVYALGATLYALLAGRAPHARDVNNERLKKAADLSERLAVYRDILTHDAAVVAKGDLEKTVGVELAAVVGKCLAAEPDGRYSTAAELAADLKAMRERRPVTPLAGSGVYRAKKFVQRHVVHIGLAVTLFVLALSFVVVILDRDALDQEKATGIAKLFVSRPEAAFTSVAGASPRVREYLSNRCREYLNSTAFTERIVGARTAPAVDPDAFWASVDGGLLWQNGEWLEIVHVPWKEREILRAEIRLGVPDATDEPTWPSSEKVLNDIAERAREGTDQQKYAAFCLVGQLAGQGGITTSDVSEYAELCVKSAGAETSPGVVMAAAWCVSRLGQSVAVPTSGNVVVDIVSGLTFVRLPGEDAYIRGAATDDRDQLPDELRSDSAVTVKPVFLSTTEVTYAAIEPFINSKASEGVFEEPAAGGSVRSTVHDMLSTIPMSEQSRTALQWVSLNAARRYCEWLNGRAGDGSPKRHYR
ncbi:MAG: protein kinase, partial [Phycisphaerales bacterium]|nr:protein kinase [Phycisphaerales bacterium]